VGSCTVYDCIAFLKSNASTRQVKIYTKNLDSDMYRTWHEPMLASMGMQKAILYKIFVYS
jgi:hypothetical protein